MIKKIFTFIFLIPVWIYQKFISPLKPPSCKYYPTCSNYAVTALKRFGPIKGTLLAIKRICRCNPWSLGGIDYVPEEYHYFQKHRKIRHEKM